MVGGAEQKCEILAIPNQYKDMLDDFIDSLDLEHLEMLRLNGQRQRNPTPNLGDDDNPFVGQEEYKKGRGVKGSKPCKERRDGKVEQVRRDRISEVRVRYVLQ